MKQLIKKTAIFLSILFAPLFLLAQQTVEFQRSTVGQMVSGSKIVEFLGSPEFKLIVIIAVIGTVIIWTFYFFSMLRLDSDDASPKGQAADPSTSFSSAFFSRGSFSMPHFGAAMPRLVPAEKKEKEEKDNKRAKKHDKIQRGK